MAVADRDELWEVKCQCILKRQIVCTISLSLAKPGEAILGVHTACTGDPRDKASASGRATEESRTESQIPLVVHVLRSDSAAVFSTQQPTPPGLGS